MPSTPPAVFPRLTSVEVALKATLEEKYVEQLWLLLTAVIGSLTIVNWSTRFFALLNKPKRATLDDAPRVSSEKMSLEASGPGRTGKIALRRFPYALASSFRNLAFRTTVPIGPSSVASVTELLFIVGYCLVILIWLFVNTQDMETFLFEDRAAHFASCQLPLIVALAGKNNIISFLTGVGYEKLNVLHRASSRACLVLLWIHALVHMVSGLPAKFDFTHSWVLWGLAGLVAFTLATILSIRPIRIMFFEFFLISHIICISVFIIGGYIHTNAQGYGDYVWPAMLIWGLDRFLRLCRLIWNNRIWSRESSDQHHATVELLTNDTVRLTLRRKMHWIAGQHAYVVLPSVSTLPTEAHPFTIASIPHALDGTKGGEEKDVVFIIRGQNGFTKRLQDHALTHGTPVSVPAYIDGPYGCPPNLKGFATCILIAGGSGVSYTLPLLLDLVHHARKGTSLCQRAVFIWVVRQPEHFKWISKLLAKVLIAAPPSLSIVPLIYITNPKAKMRDMKTIDYSRNEPSLSPSTAFNESKMAEELALVSLKARKCRPDVERLIEDAVSISTGPVSVDVAGPSSLASAVRFALSSCITSPISVMRGRPTVTLHTETFGMVKG